jgi:D-alanyl-D-alanine dipeptidase
VARIFFIFCFLISGCNSPDPVIQNEKEKTDSLEIKNSAAKDSAVIPAVKTKTVSALEMQLRNAGLVNVQELDSTIRIDLRYSTPENFVGMDVYGDFDKCFLQPDVANKLVKAQKILRKKYPFYSLIVFDAVRPLHIQRKMWDTLVLPPGQKAKYLSNPDSGSLHNYGAAVDLGIIDENGILLDMGTPFDFFGDKAHPEKEQELLASGELTERQVLNREILRDVMRQAGFFGIQTEWWHFNSCRRETAAQIYKIVE